MLTPRMFGAVPNRPLDIPPFEAGIETSFDWSARLSLENIRTHTKTDDVPSVTDEQLTLYRQAAVEAAELYTGFLLSCQLTVTEPIQGPPSVRPGKNTYKVKLQYPVADGLVYLYGGTSPEDNRTFRVPKGTRTIHVPIRYDVVDLRNCCDPCATWAINGGMMAMYKAGYESIYAVPTGIVLGMLQFVAWLVEHPGDELVTMRNRLDATSAGSQGTNNIAVVSGALELWRTYVADGF